MSRRKESSARGCHVDGCSKATFKRGYCADHYRATYGDGASSSSSASTKAGAASLFSAATVGCEDMIMLSNASEKTITENLQVRHAKNLIYTYIGHGQCAFQTFIFSHPAVHSQQEPTIRRRNTPVCAQSESP